VGPQSNRYPILIRLQMPVVRDHLDPHCVWAIRESVLLKLRSGLPWVGQDRHGRRGDRVTTVKVLTMMLGVATAIIVALVAGIISWWNADLRPARRGPSPRKEIENWRRGVRRGMREIG
jgi:hypothetical protein